LKKSGRPIDTELLNDPNRGIPIRELLKKKKFKPTERKNWFDEQAKPKKQEAESEFIPDPDVKDADI
jgi:hypothetical protein